MDAAERMAIEWECSSLANAFVYHLDRRDYQGVAECFTEDGIFFRNGQELVGRGAILETMEKRPASGITRHVTTGYHFSHVASESAVAHSTNRTYFVISDDPTLPASWAPAQTVLLDFTDTFRKTKAGWRIAERRTELVFIDDAVRSQFGLPSS